MSELMTPKGPFAPMSAPTLGSAGARRADRSLWDRVKAAARALLHRRSVYRLAELDDRTLKDIGLLRTDIDSALAEPFYRDPTTLLAERAYHRRARARTTALVKLAREKAERDAEDGNAVPGDAVDSARVTAEIHRITWSRLQGRRRRAMKTAGILPSAPARACC
jgi:Domain of unknown function (DUF1127).